MRTLVPHDRHHILFDAVDHLHDRVQGVVRVIIHAYFLGHVSVFIQLEHAAFQVILTLDHHTVYVFLGLESLIGYGLFVIFYVLFHTKLDVLQHVQAHELGQIVLQTLLHLSHTVLLHVLEHLVGHPVAESVLKEVDPYKLEVARVFQNGHHVKLLALVQGNVYVYLFYYLIVVEADLLPLGILARSVYT
uniref:ORF5 n=1 Tax=Lymantria dispar multicapsid nuclear polyhedrosis virus TaxID=10449 RepID=A0A0A0YVQ7_NPVLD|nr:hypothetical protein [Lymantria dispar multiple nucleopolyhedrovirus]AMO27506.1 hypothetical protein [Lymantria dispar multiple nucleopolyhedrovirus]AWJ76623.1 ORF5 [Lymantria dispar multiple nucleopolyhedrovirus]